MEHEHQRALGQCNVLYVSRITENYPKAPNSSLLTLLELIHKITVHYYFNEMPLKTGSIKEEHLQ